MSCATSDMSDDPWDICMKKGPAATYAKAQPKEYAAFKNVVGVATPFVQHL
ncbi:MAG: hypothetical protein JWM82_2105 [Myxococcales bacterium]|nr:hypothetical protein [Myxococcales bacterium]